MKQCYSFIFYLKKNFLLEYSLIYNVVSLSSAPQNESVIYIRTHWRRKWQPTPVFLQGKSFGQSSLAGYSSWVHKRIKHNLLTKQQQLFLVLFPIQIIMGYWVKLPVPCSRSLLVICFIYNNVHMSVPVSRFMLHHFLLWCPYICSLHLYPYFCFTNGFTRTIFLDSTYIH